MLFFFNKNCCCLLNYYVTPSFWLSFSIDLLCLICLIVSFVVLPKQSTYQGGAMFPINRPNDDRQTILFSIERKTWTQGPDYWPAWPTGRQ